MTKEPRDEIIEGHEYDGIQELDNPLPKWWQVLFYITIVFAIGYTAYYELLSGPSSDQILQQQLAEINASKQAAAQKQPQGDNVDFAKLMQDSNALAAGKAQFEQFCASCHGAHGEGMIGPNLTDDYWIYSKGDAEGVLTSLQEGFPDKGMPPWKDIVPKDQQPNLAAYVVSLRGSHPPNAKAPQGEKVD